MEGEEGTCQTLFIECGCARRSEGEKLKGNKIKSSLNYYPFFNFPLLIHSPQHVQVWPKDIYREGVALVHHLGQILAQQIRHREQFGTLSHGGHFQRSVATPTTHHHIMEVRSRQVQRNWRGGYWRRRRRNNEGMAARRVRRRVHFEFGGTGPRPGPEIIVRRAAFGSGESVAENRRLG